jgi:transposase
MRGIHYIGGDTHCKETELVVVTQAGRLTRQWRGPTTIPALAAVLEEVPRPRYLAIEEGPIADWLYRNLLPFVDGITVCEPRRNRLIAKDGDHDDAIDAHKLAQLLRGGYVKAVHHPESFERSVFKHHVGMYLKRMRQRIREANGIMAYLRRYGVFVSEAAFADPAKRQELLSSLPKNRIVRLDLLLLWEGYDVVVGQVEKMRQQLIRLARKEPEIRRFVELPGVKWIRGATFFVYVDTPWRFQSKSALWRYMGIGLERWHSGDGPMQVRVPPSVKVNRALKSMILGAAKSAIAAGDNPFAAQHKRWIDQGISPRNARRNVARSLAVVLWGMWKNGNVYRPEQVGAAMASGADMASGEDG